MYTKVGHFPEFVSINPKEEKMKKLLSISLVAMLALVMGACDGGTTTTCGAGTVEEDGTCVPMCGDDEYWDPDGAECVSVQCDNGMYFNPDTGECEEITECAPGTELVNGECLPACSDIEYWDDTLEECVEYPECGVGTVLNEATGECDPLITECAPGTVFDEATGTCIPEVVCGADTHPENGECVPNVLPEPNVPEAAENNDVMFDGTPAQFDIGAVNETVTLGGVIGVPSDLDDDGLIDADWDSFVFLADAGTYLEIRAISEGATMPAFAIWGIDDDNYIVYDRWALNPNGIESMRRAYLPIDGVYVIQVSDFTNALGHPFAFGLNTIPVGGEEFTYFIKVTTLPAPVFTDVDTIPDVLEGDFDDYDVDGYNLLGLTASDIVNIYSLGQPLPDTPNNVYGAVMLFDVAGTYIGSYRAGDDTADLFAWFAAQTDGDYQLVVDYWVLLGPAREYRVDLDFMPLIDCDVDDCTDLVLPEEDMLMIGFDVLQFEFFAATVYASADLDPVVYLLDSNLVTVDFSDGPWGDEDESVSAGALTGDTHFYLVILDYYGREAPVTFEQVQPPMDELVVGTEYTGTTLDMPNAFSMGDAIGANYFNAQETMIAYIAPPVCDTWPNESYAFARRAGLRFNYVEMSGGSLYWANNPVFPVQVGGLYEYVVLDTGGGPVTGLDYTTTAFMLDATNVGAPVYGTPVDRANLDLHTDAGVAFVQFTTEEDKAYFIDVTPTANSEILLEGQVFEYFSFDADGYLVSDPGGDHFIRWEEDPEEAAGAGDPISFVYLSFYDGDYTLMLRNLNAAAADTTFDVHIETALCVSGSNQCNGDILQDCEDYITWVDVMVCPIGCEVDEDGVAFCTLECNPGVDDPFCNAGDDFEFCNAEGFWEVRDCRVGCEVDADGNAMCTPECDPATDVQVCNADSDLETCIDSYWEITECEFGCLDVGGAHCYMLGDTCDDPRPIALVGNAFSTIADSTGYSAAHAHDGTCTGYSTAGPDIYWSIDLIEGDTIFASMDPTGYFDASIYMATDCADLDGSCVAGDDSGNPEEFTYVVPAGAGGTYIIVTTGWWSDNYGEFTFDVTVTPAP